MRSQSSSSRPGPSNLQSVVRRAWLPAGACACVLAGFPSFGCAQSGPPTSPPASVTGYALVYEDNFATDPSNANGELQNVVGSSSNPLRPQWVYRTVNKGNCPEIGASSNVFLNPGTQGRVPGLTLRDTASNPQPDNANFSSGVNEAYQTYTCGGIISNLRFGFGYYETYASVNVATTTPGFHTSFWTDYAADETDIFEDESADNTSGRGFNNGIYNWNTVGGYPIPNPKHVYTPWNAVTGGYAAPHAFGALITPKTHLYYLDGASIAGTAATPGPYIASPMYLSSVGAQQTTPTNTTRKPQSWIQYVKGKPSMTFDYSYQYVKYYQPTDPALVRAQALPPNSIFMDATAHVITGSSSFTAGNFQPFLTYPSSQPRNPNMKWGPQGFRGQNVYTSTVQGDIATWSHTFSGSEAGSYDVFVWNAASGVYQLPSPRTIYAPDAASNTVYQLSGSTGTAPTSQLISQKDAGQSWVPLNSTATAGALTNTYAFAPGVTATITLTAGNESSTDTSGLAFTPHTNADSVAFVPVSTFGTSNGATYSDTGFYSSSLQGWAGSPAARYSGSRADASARATWTAPLPAAGTYTLYAYIPTTSDTTNYAVYTILDGSTALGSAHFDQSAQGNTWVQLGTYTWNGSTATVTLQNGDGASHPANGCLRTNAIKLVAQLPADYYVCTTSTGYYGEPLFITSGSWTAGSHGYTSNGCNGADKVASTSGSKATFLPEVPVAGFYHAYLYNDPALDRSTKVVVQSHALNPATCSGLTTAGSTQWIFLGDYYFGPDSFGDPTIVDSITVSSTGSSVGASAIKLRYSGAPATATPCVNN